MGRNRTIKGLPNNLFSLTLPVKRRQIQQADASLHTRTRGRNRFIPVRLTPDLAQAAAPEGQRAHRPKRSKLPGFHSVS